MLPNSSYIILEILYESPLLFALFILLFDVPRYSLSLGALLLAGLWPRRKGPVSTEVAVVIPVHNGADGIGVCVESLMNQSLPPVRVTLVDDGSTDGTWSEMQRLRALHPSLQLLRHPQASGKSPAVNHGALLSEGELLLVLDDDVVLARHFIRDMARAFADPKVAAASGNLFVRNATRSPLTALQSLEYLQSITLGRSFLDRMGAISCVSGAVSMFRKSVFDSLGGLSVGPGEDLEITLRMRKAGYRIRFVTEATAFIEAPESLRALVRQRSRWDRDALTIKLLAYRHFRLAAPSERPSDTLMRYDFLLLELLPTMIFPFYLAAMMLHFGPGFPAFLLGLTGLLFWFYLLHGLIVLMVAGIRVSALEVLMLPLLPLYQGVFLKLVRFAAFSREILFASSRRDSFVPARIRRALYHPQTEGSR